MALVGSVPRLRCGDVARPATRAEATVGGVSSPAAELEYEVVDVFAPRAFAGNPLAVVFDADGLTTEQCQALANEFHLSETSFLCAPTEGSRASHPGSAGGPKADYRVRIFTPYAELPFAGHPSVGAAHTLVRAGWLPAGTVRQECGAGILDVVVDDDGATLSGGRPTLEDGPEPGVLAEAVGLSAADVVGVPASVAGCGLPFTFLAVRPEVVDDAAPVPALLGELGVGEGVSVLSWDAATSTAYARVFANDLEWGEDPATGSAALGTGVWLVAAGLLAPDGTSSYVVRQGEAMGRPSVLSCTVTASGGRAAAATVQGAVVPVGRGRIRVPS
jgi:trans-2,3-dihydro-3-hydroxyanthranilate isomerase